MRQMAAIELDNLLGHSIKEVAIMGNEQHSSGKGGNEILQPLDGGDIQMVGRLIEQQDIRLGHHGAGRVRGLEDLRRQRAARRMRGGDVDLRVASGVKPGKMLMEAIEVSHAFGETCIVKDFSHKIMAGDRVGLVGPNGIGKTTLLRIMLGEMKPDSGRVRHGVRLAPAFLTQMRELNPELKIRDVLLPLGGQYVHVGGHEPRHVVSYMQDFLFDKERLNSPVSALSGGERGRLMLAKLLLEPANLLVLDEPTNDLDIGTLAMLELALAKYEGTVILVSHDRAFMDRVASRVLAFEGKGLIVPVEGGYSDYAAWRQLQAEKAALEVAEQKARKPAQVEVKLAKKATKLSYKEKRELDALPAGIEKLEEEKAGIEANFCDSDYFNNNPKAFQDDQQRLTVLQSELSTAYARWEELEAKQESMASA